MGSISEEMLKAREDAVAEVGRLLQFPEDLENILNYKRDYSAVRETIRQQLQTALEKEIESTLEGLQSLRNSKVTLEEFQNRYSALEKCCNESNILMNDHKDIMRRLSVVHSNTRGVLSSAELISDLPRKANEVEEALNRSEDVDLVPTYIRLAELEAVASKIQMALQLTNRGREGRNSSLQAYFTQVYHAMTKFEEKLWSICRSFRELCLRNPTKIISAIQIIEIQEKLDSKILNTGKEKRRMIKCWRKRFIEQIAASIQESFAMTLQNASKILAAGDRAGEALMEVLDETMELVRQLQGFKKYGLQCFPSKYDMLSFLCTEYHKHVSNIVSLAGLSAKQLSSGDIIKAISWIGDYQIAISQCSGSMKYSCFKDDPDSGALLLLNEYVGRIADTLDSWIDNLLEVDFASGPNFDSDGRAWTPGAIEFYRILNEQLSAASKGGPPLIARVAFESARALRSFQSGIKDHLSKSAVTLEFLCALANNITRCKVLGEEFSKRVHNFLEQSHGSFAIENLSCDAAVAGACEAFSQIGDYAMTECINIVFSDPGFIELFKEIACSEAWISGTISGSVIATLDDFWQDFERMLVPTLHSTFAKKIAYECSAYYVASLVTQLRTVQPAVLRALERDADKLASFFNSLASFQDGTSACRPITDITEFLSSDSVENFVLSYTSLLDTSPGISPAFLSNLLTARVNSDHQMTKADAKEILEACRQYYVTRQHSTETLETVDMEFQNYNYTTKPLKPAFRRDVAFIAALNASKKRR